MIDQNILTTKDQSDEEIPQCGTRCEFEPNGSESKIKKIAGGLVGFVLLVLPFALLSVMAWASTKDGASLTVKQAQIGRKMEETMDAQAEACELCSEANFTARVDELYAGFESTFGHLRDLIVPASDELAADGTDNMAAMLAEIASNLDVLLDTVEREDLEEFYFYYLIRYLTGSLGAQFYQGLYLEYGEYIEQCQAFGSVLNLTCPPLTEEVDLQTANQYLLNWADNVFSSICTSGFPAPFWSEPDGSGVLFVANNQSQTLHPVSGSGINMSAPIESLNDYFVYSYFGGHKVDPTSLEWKELVEVNPLYSWLMSSLTPAEEGTVCGNGNLTGLNSGIETYDTLTAEVTANFTQRWCTAETIPNEEDPGTGDYTKQHFAKMWYGLLVQNFGELVGETETDNPWSTCCRDLLVDFGVVSA